MVPANMSLDGSQDFIDYLLPVLFPIYFMTLWLCIGALISFMGGWYSLAQRYRMREPFTGEKWRMQSGQMRWLTNYNSVLTLGANQEGLYLACMFLFRFMQPPLLIPWSEIVVRRTDGSVFKYVTFTMDRQKGIPLRIRASLAECLRGAAGNAWPIEVLSPT